MWIERLLLFAFLSGLISINFVVSEEKISKKTFHLEYRDGDIVEYNFDPRNQMSFLICNRTFCNATIESYHPEIKNYKHNCTLNMTVEKPPISAFYAKPKVFANKTMVIVWLTVANDGKYLNIKLVNMTNCKSKNETFLLGAGRPNVRSVDYSSINAYMKDKVNIAIFNNSFDVIYQSYMCYDIPTSKIRDKLGFLCRVSYDIGFNRIRGPSPFFPQIKAIEKVSTIANINNTFSWYLITGLKGLFLAYPNDTFVELKRNNFILSNDLLNVRDSYTTLKWYWYNDLYRSEFIKISPNYESIRTQIKLNVSRYDDTVRDLSDVFYLPTGDVMFIMFNKDANKFHFRILNRRGKIVEAGDIVKIDNTCYWSKNVDGFYYKGNFDYICDLGVTRANQKTKSQYFSTFSKKVRF